MVAQFFLRHAICWQDLFVCHRRSVQRNLWENHLMLAFCFERGFSLLMRVSFLKREAPFFLQDPFLQGISCKTESLSSWHIIGKTYAALEWICHGRHCQITMRGRKSYICGFFPPAKLHWWSQQLHWPYCTAEFALMCTVPPWLQRLVSESHVVHNTFDECIVCRDVHGLILTCMCVHKAHLTRDGDVGTL